MILFFQIRFTTICFYLSGNISLCGNLSFSTAQEANNYIKSFIVLLQLQRENYNSSLIMGALFVDLLSRFKLPGRRSSSLMMKSIVLSTLTSSSMIVLVCFR